jgi:VanZ family protein
VAVDGWVVVTGRAARTWAWPVGFAVALAVQLYGLYAPRQPGPSDVPYLDKVAHCTIFAVVAYFGLRARVPRFVLLGYLVAQAVGSEFVQHYLLAHRSGDPFDTVADLTGAAIGTWLGFRAVRSTKVAGHDMMGS